jgi:hypothetical protein
MSPAALLQLNVQPSHRPCLTPVCCNPPPAHAFVSVQVWRRPRRSRKRGQPWEQEVTFAVLPDPEEIKEARRRRRPPPAPSIDQISWSADDRR